MAHLILSYVVLTSDGNGEHLGITSDHDFILRSATA